MLEALQYLRAAVPCLQVYEIVAIYTRASLFVRRTIEASERYWRDVGRSEQPECRSSSRVRWCEVMYELRCLSWPLVDTLSKGKRQSTRWRRKTASFSPTTILANKDSILADMDCYAQTALVSSAIPKAESHFSQTRAEYHDDSTFERSHMKVKTERAPGHVRQVILGISNI